MENYSFVYYGNTLRKIRKNRNMTQQELAERSSLDPSYISLLERELKKPGYDTIFFLAIGLGMAASELLKEIEEHPENQWLKETIEQGKKTCNNTNEPTFFIVY